VPALLSAARAVANRHGVALSVRGSAGAGVLYAGMPADTDAPRPAGPVGTPSC
jgi:glycolate oxidase FAD binding subunit